jgi:hypothetical protein
VNKNDRRLRPRSIRQALHILAPLLLSGLSTECIGSRTRPSVRLSDWRIPERDPYLTSVGAPALRFRVPDPEPEHAPRPVAIGPPVAGLNVAESAVAAANTAARLGPEVGEPKPVEFIAPPRDSPTAPTPGETARAALAESAKPAPRAILPDETRPRVRPEDFIPYFQMPGATPLNGANSTPVPNSLPPSSATYQQTPR